MNANDVLNHGYLIRYEDGQWKHGFVERWELDELIGQGVAEKFNDHGTEFVRLKISA